MLHAIQTGKIQAGEAKLYLKRKGLRIRQAEIES
jgi:hypothetical protein